MDKRGISPVVGSVLLIVITVVIAAMIVTFVLPFVNDSLDESQACLDVLDAVEFAESKFNCYNGTSAVAESGYENGFSIKLKKDGVEGFRVAFLDDVTGSSQVYDIFNETIDPNLKMIGGNYDKALEIPNAGGQRSYVVKQVDSASITVNPYSNAEISPILKSGQVCSIADMLDFRACPNDVVL